MRKLIAWVFMYSLDGLLADDGTEYWQFCFGLPVDPAELQQKIDLYESAYAHIMGRTSYGRLRNAAVRRVAIERPDGPVVDELMEGGFEVVVVSSRSIKALRDRYGTAGSRLAAP